VWKRGSPPVCSASLILEFSYEEEPQTLIMPLEETEGTRSVQAMTAASEEQKH